jgi:HD superfamily phosphohydrolase YqeK
MDLVTSLLSGNNRGPHLSRSAYTSEIGFNSDSTFSAIRRHTYDPNDMCVCI